MEQSSVVICIQFMPIMPGIVSEQNKLFQVDRKNVNFAN